MEDIINRYMNLPYNIIIQPISDESGDYFYARVPEFDGCQSDGKTFDEAYKGIREAMAGWIETKIAYGFSVPEPTAGVVS